MSTETGAPTVSVASSRSLRRRDVRHRMRRMWMLYVFFAVPAVLLFIFNYIGPVPLRQVFAEQ